MAHDRIRLMSLISDKKDRVIY